MKLLFLDIDGVLNHQDFYDTVYTDVDGNVDELRMKEWRENNPYPLSEFDPSAVSRVNDVLNKTGARLVVSSSWRVGDNGELKNIFRAVGLPTEFDVTPLLCLWMQSIDGREPCRGDEIKKYMDDLNEDVESYVILDDDNNMLPEQENNFVLCDYLHGFTEKDKEKAISILMS